MKTKDRNIPADRSVLVLVEGDDDLYTLSNYTGKHPDPTVRAQYRAIHFFPYAESEPQMRHGLDALRYALQEVPTIPGFQNIQAVGVLCDADMVSPGGPTAKAATITHVQSAIGSVNWSVPHTPGTWVQHSPIDLPNPKWIGFLVVPPNRDSGSLETMLWESVHNDIANLKECAEGLLNCAEPIYAERFPDRFRHPNHENWRDKVRVHALLAASEEPQTHTTNATLRGYWNFDSPGLSAVMAFLREGQRIVLGH